MLTKLCSCWSRDGHGGFQLETEGYFAATAPTQSTAIALKWVHTPFGPNRHLHDYTGHGPDVWTNQDGWGYFTFGPNVFGSAQNYVAYALEQHRVPEIPIPAEGPQRYRPIPPISVRLPFDSPNGELLLQSTHEL